MVSERAREPKTPFVLALDIGTSSTRAMLFDAAGDAVECCEAKRPYQLATTQDGGVEGDPAALLLWAVEAIDEVLLKAGERAGAIAGVGISCFWHSLMAVDAAGLPLTPVYSWADTRSATAADALRAELDEDALHDRTGCVLHTSYWPAKLRWLTTTRPAMAAQVSRWLGFPDYLLQQLCGEPRCGVSMASGTGLLDQQAATWHAPLLAALGLDPDQLPPLAEHDGEGLRLVADYARRWPALAGVPWFPAAGDGACNNVGSGCVTPDRLALSIGTSGVMRVVIPTATIEIPRRLWCYRIDRRRYVLGGALSNTGNVTDWLRATLRLPPDAADRVAELPPDQHGLTMLPLLAGERTPRWRPRARAALVGLALDTTPLEILRAGLEAVACRFALVHDLLRPLASDQYQIICSGGGAVHWPCWPQIIADALGQPLTLSGEPEASARGAALLALEALGVLPDLAAVPIPPGPTMQPNADNHLIYQRTRARMAWLDGVLDPALVNPTHPG